MPRPARAQDSGGFRCQNGELPSVSAGPRSVWNAPVAGRAGVTRTTLVDNVVVECDEAQIFADRMEVQSDEDVARLTGHVVFAEPSQGVRITAVRAEIDKKTRLGTFYDAGGYVRLADSKTAERSLFGTLEPDAYFHGARLDKIGERQYRLTDGAFTTCVQATPRWELTGSRATVTLDKRAVLKNAVLRVKNVPLLYVPYIYYPISHDDRATGFLLPTYGTSTVRGFSLSNAFFWAIGRSQDLTLYHDWFKRAGQGLGAEYRYTVAPGSEGNARFYLLKEHTTLLADGVTVDRPAHQSYEIRGNVNQALARGFRVIGRANYFTDAATQQLYQQNVFDLSQRTRYLGATITGGLGPYRFSANAEQNDIYYGASYAQRQGNLPRINVSAAQKPIGRSPVYAGASAEVGYILRQDDITKPETDHSLWRIDASPSIRVPLSRLSFLSVTTSANWRYTRWSESRDPITHVQVPVPLDRQLFGFTVRAVGPVVSRVWQTPDSGYAERIKHSIEPSVALSWLSSFADFDQVVQSDGTDFIYGGTTRLTYGLANHLYARRRTAGGGVVREILTVDLSQSYYTDARASQYHQQFQSSFGGLYNTYVPPTPFSPLRIAVTAHPAEHADGQFSMELDPTLRIPRTLGASGSFTAPLAQVTAGWSKRQYIPELPGFDNPELADHFLNAMATARTRNNGVGVTFAFNYDARRGYFVQRRIVAHYSSQCCGVALDYQTVNRTRFGLPNDRRIGLSFTLAGIGSFSNPFGAFGNNTGSR